MSLYNTKAIITITCPKRLASYLQKEVQDLGFEIEEIFVTGVKLSGTINDCIKLNLNLRCASQVLYSLKHFEATDADNIYSNVAEYPWEDILPDPGYFSITSNVNNETINNSMYANLRVKDAIVDRIRDKKGTRPSTGSALNSFILEK